MKQEFEQMNSFKRIIKSLKYEVKRLKKSINYDNNKHPISALALPSNQMNKKCNSYIAKSCSSEEFSSSRSASGSESENEDERSDRENENEKICSLKNCVDKLTYTVTSIKDELDQIKSMQNADSIENNEQFGIMSFKESIDCLKYEVKRLKKNNFNGNNKESLKNVISTVKELKQSLHKINNQIIVNVFPLQEGKITELKKIMNDLNDHPIIKCKTLNNSSFSLYQLKHEYMKLSNSNEVQNDQFLRSLIQIVDDFEETIQSIKQETKNTNLHSLTNDISCLK